MFVYLLAFLFSAAIVVVAGTFLTRCADTIAEATGLGRAWVGSVLLATATSLPELATDVAAVRMHAPNLAAGDLFGSSLANMLILAVLDQMNRRRGSILRGAAIENALVACLAIILNTLAALFVLLRPTFMVWRISPESILLLLVFLAGSRAVYRSTGRQAALSAPKQDEGSVKETPRLWPAAAIFAGGSAAILVAAPALAWSARYLAELSGLGNTLVGTWLLGLVTSLPEFVTALAAIRLGAFDLAIGNLFGSNSFNMVIFFALDLAYSGGSIFANLSPVNAVSGLLAVVLMGLGLANILYRAERRFVMIEPGSALMILAYLFSLFVIYTEIKR